MLATDLMARFADRTGLTEDLPPRRYLWTDAFAVCNYVALGRLDLARALVDQVHHVLGRHRPDDARRGWISGLSDEDGETHPTLGGLRIGKPLPERARGEPLDERLEWDRDGQYFHYATKWMHALDQLARVTADATVARHALELADAARRTFVHGPAGRRRMSWKLSVDLSRPLVPSMGQHDPVDGYVTCLQLEATRRQLGARGPELGDALDDFRAMLDLHALTTTDPLGLGGLLFDAYRLDQLGAEPGLRDALLAAAEHGLVRYSERSGLELPVEHRLAFRELGLALGLRAAARMHARRIARFAALGTTIEAAWCAPAARRSATYVEHADINDVMLASCLAPDGVLELHRFARRTTSGVA